MGSYSQVCSHAKLETVIQAYKLPSREIEEKFVNLGERERDGRLHKSIEGGFDWNTFPFTYRLLLVKCLKPINDSFGLIMKA
jgi:hypothetical protein